MIFFAVWGRLCVNMPRRKQPEIAKKYSGFISKAHSSFKSVIISLNKESLFYCSKGHIPH